MGNCLKSPHQVVQEIHDNNVKKVSMIVPQLSYRSLPLLGSTYRATQNSHPLPVPNPTHHTQTRMKPNEVLPTPKSNILTEIPAENLKAFIYSELQIATKNFRSSALLGEGGFGCVFKGWLNEETLSASSPESGMPVAIKKLNSKGYQGHKEWLSEINYLGQLHHPNLVKLIGYCVEEEHRLLVYEYMPQGSLENHIFKDEQRTKPLSWETRLKIAIGAARGLCFLHNYKSPIIYRDFKSSNILLDKDFNTKLSDFGLAKAGPIGNMTHVSTEVMGTEGYTAPEYYQTGRLTNKCDVFGFGIVLLELLTGRRAIEETKGGKEEYLIDWVKPKLIEKGKVHRIMDSRLEGQYPRKKASFIATLGLLCVHPEPRYRPNMSDVLNFLEKLSTQSNAEVPTFEQRNQLATPPPLQSNMSSEESSNFIYMI